MRTESIKFNDFMDGKYKKTRKRNKGIHLKSITRGLVTIPMVAGLSNHHSTFAATQESVPVVAEVTKDSIIHAFDPLIDLMIDLALPIAGVMITGGALLIMIGQKDKGFTLIMNSGIGYVLVNLSPLLLSLLESVGKAI